MYCGFIVFLTYLSIVSICAKQHFRSSKNKLLSDIKPIKRPMSEIIIESFNPYQAKLVAREAQEAAESAHSNLVFARKQADINAASAASFDGQPTDYFKTSASGSHKLFLINQDKAESEAEKAALDAAKEAHAAALASQQQLIFAKEQAELVASSLRNSIKYDKKASEKAYAGKHKIMKVKKKNKKKNKVNNPEKSETQATSLHPVVLETTTVGHQIKFNQSKELS